MHIRLENKESHKAQEIGNLIRTYNRSKREEAESVPLNLYLEDEKGNLSSRDFRKLVGNRIFVCERGIEGTRNRFKIIAAS